MGLTQSRPPVTNEDLLLLKGLYVKLTAEYYKKYSYDDDYEYYIDKSYPYFQLKPIGPIITEKCDFSIIGSLYNNTDCFILKINYKETYNNLNIKGILHGIELTKKINRSSRCICGYYNRNISILKMLIDNNEYLVEIESPPYKHVGVYNNPQHIETIKYNICGDMYNDIILI